jgi:DMSO/TMAO reductase YedYZ molybdopterin-dependent catalytic subunit
MRNKLVISTLLLTALIIAGCTASSTGITVTQPVPSSQTTIPPSSSPSAGAEVEATEYLGVKLTPLSQQLNNALAGTQHIDRTTYRLQMDGMVDRILNLTYNDLLALPQISEVMEMDCVEGWNFTAKWTGPSLKSIFDAAGVKPGALIAIFHTADVPQGYSSLDLSYILDRNVILGMKINDLTLPEERGFPFQVVAESKFGYKWAKWVTEIELSDRSDFRGYWESAGYNNDANINGPAFGP